MEPMTKACNRCKVDLSFDNFHKGNGKYNLESRCKKCCKHYKKNSAEYKRGYYSNNKDKHLESVAKYRDKNLAKVKEYQKEWASKNRGLRNAAEAKRRATKLNATFDGYDEELKEIYRNCPKGYHVDHIYPLQGKNCCGLHVPWNLQYLTAEENLKKSNKIVS